jgi:hypothetical protein
MATELQIDTVRPDNLEDLGGMEPSINKKMGIIGIELLTKATLCAVTVGVVAGMAALLLFRLT